MEREPMTGKRSSWESAGTEHRAEHCSAHSSAHSSAHGWIQLIRQALVSKSATGEELRLLLANLELSLRHETAQLEQGPLDQLLGAAPWLSGYIRQLREVQAELLEMASQLRALAAHDDGVATWNRLTAAFERFEEAFIDSDTLLQDLRQESCPAPKWA